MLEFRRSDRRTDPRLMRWKEFDMESAVGASIGTPEHLIVVARQGRLPKEVLVRFLAIDKRPVYLAACSAIEKRYTESVSRQAIHASRVAVPWTARSAYSRSCERGSTI